MNIKINDTEITLKNTFRSLIVYEGIMGKTFTPNGITEILTYFYSVAFASAKGLQITFDDFMDYIDENPDKLTEFMEWITQNDKVNEQFNKEEKKSQRKATAKK